MGKISMLMQQLHHEGREVLAKLYGPDDMDLQAQTEAFANLLKQFRSVYGDADAALFSSPGRTEIGGNHTDHNHGRVLAGAVNIDNIAVAAANGMKMVRISSAGYPAFEVDLSHSEPRPDEKYTPASLVRGIAARMQELGFRAEGFDACIEGRVPKGSGLSSSASFEVLIGVIFSELFNSGRLDPLQNAIIGQYAENNYFGKPCGLMDQTACATGGFITIDFKDPSNPVVKKIDFDFLKTGFSLVITDTGGNHADLSDEYATLPAEMKSVAHELGGSVQRDVTMEEVIKAIPQLRKRTGDRAILRAMHFQGDNERVARQVEALENNDFQSFLAMVTESGYSSFMYNQNVFAVHDVREQSVALGLALSEWVLKGKGAWRVHGGGFAGTIQAFVPNDLVTAYTNTLEHVFGISACQKLAIRGLGACRLKMG